MNAAKPQYRFGSIPRQLGAARSGFPRGNRAFTLIELLVVIAIIGLLAGLVVGLAGIAGRSGRESKIRAQLRELETAIKAYQSKFGHYPPDHVVSRNPLIVDPARSPLYYELTGTVLTNNGFRLASRDQIISSLEARNNFGVDGFVHASTDPKQIKPFIQVKPAQRAVLAAGASADIEVLVVPLPWPTARADQPVPAKPGLNPWRYVSTNPTNNPTTFDLWAEFVDGGKIKIIGNWSNDILEK